MKSRLIAFVFIVVSVQGCSVYKPKAAFPSSYKDQIVADVGSRTLLQTYNAMAQSTTDEQKLKVARRNQILNELIYLVDDNYYSFENRFYGSQAAFGTGADALNLGLTAASSVTGTAELKSILSAVATGTTGFKTSIEKNYFDQQSRAAIVTKMRSLRTLQLATLQDATHMKAGVTEYSLEQGLSDVNAYYDAGTLVGALQGIAASVGTDTKQATDKQQTNSSQTQQVQ